MGNFIRVSNKDGKVWLIPIKHMRTGLSLYQPSGIKGRLLRALLPYIYKIPSLDRIVDIKRVDFSLSEDVVSTVKRVLGLDEFEFSIFEGTPSVHQKRVIQIFQGTKILAYCKISNKREVIDLIKGEKQILDYFNSVGLYNIPICYSCSKTSVDKDDFMLIESTIKSNHFKAVHKWSDNHWRVLASGCGKTMKRSGFSDTDLSRSLVELESYLDILTAEEAEAINYSVSLVRAYYQSSEGEQVDFSAYHGDLTPWNMFVEDGKLFIFDFEYSGLSYPPFLDWFHFFTQTNILERHHSAQQIYERFLRVEAEVASYCGDARVCYRAYLLDIICRYIRRKNRELPTSTREQIALWVELLIKLK